MNNTLFLFLTTFFIFTQNLRAQQTGCIDKMANNYNASASVNDGSCEYDLDAITPILSFELNPAISETSGLIKWDDKIWTHNDSGGDTNLYALDTLNGNVVQTVALTGTLNSDWEEISQDADYIYVGDFGNNTAGNRTDLKILRICKNSILSQTPVIDTIYFSYSNQTVFTPSSSNNTDFDCEAFIVSTDSIFLFTKQWDSEKTSVYSLPKTPGNYVAQLKSTLNVQGLITGSVYLQSENLIALCGYTKSLKPFIYLLYDFQNTDFFSGNKRKILISLPFHQMEGITTSDGLKYYLSNERFPQASVLQKLHVFDLSDFTSHYLFNTLSNSEIGMEASYAIHPNPANQFIAVESSSFQTNESYLLINQIGQIVLKGKLTSVNRKIDISTLESGTYFLTIDKETMQSFKVIKN